MKGAGRYLRINSPMISPEQIAAIGRYQTWHLQSIIPEMERRIKWIIEDPPAPIDWQNEIGIAEERGEDEYAVFLIEESKRPPTDWGQEIKEYELLISLCKGELAQRGQLTD
jgi:hypothetical protein